jgi:hypothetical protein
MNGAFKRSRAKIICKARPEKINLGEIAFRLPLASHRINNRQNMPNILLRNSIY